MADDTTTTTAPATEVSQTETTTTATPEKTYTQAEVDALVRQTKDREYAEARRTMKQPKRTEDVKEKKAADGGSEERFARTLAQRDALEEFLSDRTVNAKQRKALRDWIQTDNPDDPSAWIEEKAALFLGASPTPDPTKQTKETSVAPPPVHPGPPQGAQPWDRPSDPFKWTDADVQQLIAQKGPREAQRIIRKKGEEFARTMRIQMTPQRR